MRSNIFVAEGAWLQTHDVLGTAATVKADLDFTDFLVNMSASADVLAMAKVEVDLSSIPEGKNVRLRFKTLFRDANDNAGHHQMAGKACVCSPQNSSGDRGGKQS